MEIWEFFEKSTKIHAAKSNYSRSVKAKHLKAWNVQKGLIQFLFLVKENDQNNLEPLIKDKLTLQVSEKA